MASGVVLHTPGCCSHWGLVEQLNLVLKVCCHELGGWQQHAVQQVGEYARLIAGDFVEVVAAP